MGCGGSGGDKKIRMQKTKLSDLDEVFDDAQGLIDEIYGLKDPIEDKRDALLDSTQFDKVKCGNTHHATVGIVFAMWASSKSAEDAKEAFVAKAEAPFLEINKKSASGNLVKCIDDFTEYVQALGAAQERVPALAEKAQQIAEKAPDLPDKAKSGVEGATDLGAMDK